MNGNYGYTLAIDWIHLHFTRECCIINIDFRKIIVSKEFLFPLYISHFFKFLFLGIGRAETCGCNSIRTATAVSTMRKRHFSFAFLYYEKKCNENQQVQKVGNFWLRINKIKTSIVKTSNHRSCINLFLS